MDPDARIRAAIEEHRRASCQPALHRPADHWTGSLWVSECVITYDGVPTYSVSIMEFVYGYVVHESQYFAGTFGAPHWRAALAEPMPGRSIASA